MKPTRSRSTTLAILACVIFTAPTFAGPNRWTSRGPDGGLIEAIIAEPNKPRTLYLASFGSGIFKSENAGETWSAHNNGVSDLIVMTLAIRPDKPSTLFAGTLSGRILRSVDAGEHWTEIRLASAAIVELLYDDVTNVLYALPSGLRLLQSANDGETWTENPFSLPLERIATLKGKLYALSRNGLFVSSDRGTQWTPLFTTIRSTSISADEESGALVASADQQIAISYDGGSKWSVFAVPLPDLGVYHRVLATAPYPGGVLVASGAGVFRFNYDDDTWHVVGQALTGKYVPLVYQTRDIEERIFAFNEDNLSLHVLVPRDADWRTVPVDLTSAPAYDVAVMNGIAYAATSRGLATAGRDAARWTTVPIASSPTQGVSNITASANGTLIASTGDGVHKSGDSGLTWKAISPDFFSAVGIAPANPATIYASLASGMQKSTDGGETWTPTQNDMPLGYYFYYYGFYASTVAVDPIDAATVYVCSDGTFKSVDGGATWKMLTSVAMQDLVIDPHNRQTLYGAPYSGNVVKSTDGGASWSLVNLTGYIIALAIDPSREGVVYAARSTRDILESVDGGLHWKSISDGLPGAYIYDLAVDESGRNLYTATVAGVFEYARDDSALSGAKTYRVTLRTAASNYVGAENCGEGRVVANETSAGPCEAFTLYDKNGGQLADGDEVFLRAANDSFVAAESGGASACAGCESPLHANRRSAGPWETFTIHRIGATSGAITDGDSISLQSQAGDYIAAEHGGQKACGCDSVLNANRAIAQSWETFVIGIQQ